MVCLVTGRKDKEPNYFKVNASQPLSVWRAKGWIHPDDPRGWFQWHCRSTWIAEFPLKMRIKSSAG